MKKKTKRTVKICVIVLCAVILGSIALSAVFGEKDIYIEYNGMKTRHGTNYIVFDIENNTGKDITFGENHNNVIVTTTENAYYLSAPDRKITGTTDRIKIDAEDLEGDVEKIEIVELLLLDKYDSTDAEMHSIVVYDEDGIDSFSGNFSRIQLSYIFGALPIILFMSFFVFVFVMVILSIVYMFKNGGKSIGMAFHNSGDDELLRETNRLFQQAHQNAHDLHTSMHETSVNSFNDMTSSTMFMNNMW